MELKLCHLYGNLLNTYGDNGNILVLQYYAKKMGIDFSIELVSLDQPFDPNRYDLVFFGGGQDYEQVVVSRDIVSKQSDLTTYIENDGVVLAICGGYQLLGHYYIGADGEKIPGIGALDHYTLSQENSRFIGNIKIKNETTNEIYRGFENHNGRTFLGPDEKPLGTIIEGKGNNGEDKTEGAIYKNVYCSYFHGPILTHNGNLAKRLILTALKNRYPDADLSQYEAFPIEEA